MAKDESINLRFSKKEKERLRRNAEDNNLSMAEYIRECIYLRDDENVITKQELAAMLCDIAAFLDCEEVRDTKLAKKMRRRFKKLWELL